MSITETTVSSEVGASAVDSLDATDALSTSSSLINDFYETPEEKSERRVFEVQLAKCEHFLRYSLGQRKVKHLLDVLAINGCSIDDKTFFSCVTHEVANGMRFVHKTDDTKAEARIEIGLVNSAEINSSFVRFSNRLTHELLRTYDWCRAEIDESDCRQLACAEIRASRLSGECHPSSFTEETGRVLRYALKHDSKQSGEGLRCIRHNAAQRVDQYAHCHSKDGSGKQAWNAVNDAWMTCFRDIDPFHDRADAW